MLEAIFVIFFILAFGVTGYLLGFEDGRVSRMEKEKQSKSEVIRLIASLQTEKDLKATTKYALKRCTEFFKLK